MPFLLFIPLSERRQFFIGILGEEAQSQCLIDICNVYGGEKAGFIDGFVKKMLVLFCRNMLAGCLDQYFLLVSPMCALILTSV